MHFMADSTSNATAATFDFRRARRRAALSSVMAQLRGEDARLLSYEVVRRKLKAVESAEQRLEDVPVDAIIGSVGRYQDFTREFLPLVDEDRGRWVGVKLAMTGLEGVPPVELYRIGDAYFVKDGNHRVSVARQLGAKTINAYVTPVHSRVPIGSDVDYQALILATEYAEFLDATGIDELRPEADLQVTEAGQYPLLTEHIQVHQYYMGMARDGPVPWQEAVTHWYDEVYRPVAAAIAQHDLLARFPGRTEADLYLFLSKHRGQLEGEFGWSLEGVQLAEGLSAGGRLDVAGRKERLQKARQQTAQLQDDRSEAAVRGAAKPGAAKPGATKPGAAERRAVREDLADLIDAVLVVSDGADGPSFAAYAATVAAEENATLLGLRLGAPATEEDAEATRQRFRQICEAAGVNGQLAYAEGNKVSAVLARADYVDLIVVGAPLGFGAKRQPWLRALAYRTRKPLLLARTAATEGSSPSLQGRPLLAYDGGERAEAALFWLAYLCLTRGLSPVVVTVGEATGGAAVLAKAGDYLVGLGLEPELILEHGPVAPALLRVAQQVDADLIVMGSHKYNRWLERVTGGVLDDVVREAAASVLIT